MWANASVVPQRSVSRLGQSADQRSEIAFAEALEHVIRIRTEFDEVCSLTIDADLYGKCPPGAVDIVVAAATEILQDAGPVDLMTA